MKKYFHLSCLLMCLQLSIIGKDCPRPYLQKVSCLGPKYEIKELNGAPALYINAKPTVPIFASKVKNWATGDFPKVRDGVLTLTNQPKNYTYRSLTSTQRFGKNYTAEVVVKIMKATGNGSNATFYVQLGSGGNYLLSLIEVKGKKRVRFWKEEAGLKGGYLKWATKPFAWEYGKPYLLKLKVQGSIISAFVNNQLIGIKKDAKVLKGGKIKLGVYHAIAEFDKVTVRSDNKKVVFNDDFSIPRSWEWSARPLKKAKSFKDIGMHIYTHAGWGGLFNWDKSFRSHDNKYDFKKIDTDISAILKDDPDAFFVPRVTIRPPRWWIKKHSDEMMKLKWANGTEAQYKYAAFSSKLWIEEVSEYLRQYIRHINSQPYGKRVLGLTLMAGGGGENVYSFEPFFFDYSKPQLTAYRAWLKKHYNNNVASLRKAWNNPSATFETALIPSPASKTKAFDFEFRDPAKAKSITDYMHFHSIAVTTFINKLSKVIKEETSGKKLVFVFYGYFMGMSKSPNSLESGHMDYNNLLKSSYIDCFGSLHSYNHRQLGGVTISGSPVDSASLYGKMPFSEDDPRTHLSSNSSLHQQEGRTNNMQETLNVIKRDFAYFLSKNSGFWYLDWGKGWFNDNAIMNLLEKIRNITKESLFKDRRKNDEIAVIVSEKSYDYLRNSDNLLNDLTSRQICEELTRLGAPFGTYLLSSLDKIPDHKLYIFLNAFHLTDYDRNVIESKVKQKGKTALWLYAPGYVTDKNLSIDAIRKLTGISLAKINTAASLNAQTVNVSSIGKGIFKPGIVWGNSKVKLGPVFYCNDPDSTTLAVFKAPANKAFSDKPAMAIKDINGWRSIWCGVPNIPSGILKEIARSSGVHIYAETDDFVVANRFMVSLHAKKAGKRTISLPRRMNVTDAFSGKHIATKADKFTVDFVKGETGLWFVE